MHTRYGKTFIPEMQNEKDRIHLAKRYLLISTPEKDKAVSDQLIAFYEDFIVTEDNRIPNVIGLFEVKTDSNQHIQFRDRNAWEAQMLG